MIGNQFPPIKFPIFHPTKSGKVTVPNHKGDIAPGTRNSILK
ncbi:type II toxin-antitoxin system HicA family toxin [Thermicanus aegyptius]